MGRRGGKSADVRSLDALRDARYALAEFRTTVRLALQEASSEVHRTLWWLEHDQLTHWKAQIKRRERLLQDARTELNRAQIAAMDSQVTEPLELILLVSPVRLITSQAPGSTEYSKVRSRVSFVSSLIVKLIKIGRAHV